MGGFHQEYVPPSWGKGNDQPKDPENVEGKPSDLERFKDELDLAEDSTWDDVTVAARNYDGQTKKMLTFQQAECERYNLPEDATWEEIALAARKKAESAEE